MLCMSRVRARDALSGHTRCRRSALREVMRSSPGSAKGMKLERAIRRIGPWRHSFRAMLEIDRAQVQPLRGLRLALGAAFPLVGGVATGYPEIGAFASGGALGVGFGGFLGVYRTQAATMIAAAASIGVSLFVGSVGGHSAAVTIALVVLWGFGAGLLGVFGPAAYFVGLQAVLHLLLGSGFPADVHDAAVRALAAFAGGILQTALAVGVWPWRRFATERAALANAYRTLSHYARGAGDAGIPPPSLAASGIYAVLADPHPFANHSDVSTFQRLLDEAEQIRVSLAAISARTMVADEATMVREAVGSVLNEIAEAVYAGRAPAGEEQTWRVLQPDSALPSVRADPACMRGVRTMHVRRLLGQLRAAWRIATDASREHADARFDPAFIMGSLNFDAPVRTLRAALTVRSSAFRHALRIAIAVALATALARAMSQPNGYWLPIAVLLVLQPGFGDTMTRGLGMMSGTVAGAVVATLIAALLRPEHWTLAALIAVIAWLCFTIFRANYAMFAVCITAYVVFLVSFFGLPEPVAALHRVVATTVGGLLALAAYALWPTWEARQVRQHLAAALDAQARYAAALLAQIGAPETTNDAVLARARLDAQLERSDAEESVERMLAEPHSGGGLAPSIALGILAAVRTFAVAGLTLDATRPEAACPPWPSLRPLAKSIEQSLLRIAAALRSDFPPAPLPPLRALHARLADKVLNADSAARIHASECPPLWRLVISETDLMVDSVDAMASLACAPAAAVLKSPSAHSAARALM